MPTTTSMATRLLFFSVCITDSTSFITRSTFQGLAPQEQKHDILSRSLAELSNAEGVSIGGNYDHDLSKLNRRSFIARSSILSSIIGANTAVMNANVEVALADESDEDLTNKLYNPDGSLRNPTDGANAIETEAKSRIVPVSFPHRISNDIKSAIVSIDGSKVQTDVDGKDIIEASYQIPEKWTAAPEYIDTVTSQQKACDRVVIAQLPGTFSDNKQLDRATTIGVAKALGITTSVEKGVFPNGLGLADIVNGKKTKKLVDSNSGEDGDQRMYYEFDLAVAPDTCGSSAENLGLGFCPYDTIVLLSATIVDGTMMVLGVTCTKEEWKRSNADLKRVRNSFFVESKPMV